MRKLSFWKKKYQVSWLSLCAWRNVSLMLLALLALSCRTTKENTSMLRSDSLTWNRKVSVTLATIPSSIVKLTIPTDSLRNLPSDAGYTAKSGQAGLKVTYRDGNIHAVATCDSLQQQVFSLEEELHQARDRLEQVYKESKPAVIPFMVKFKWYLMGILTAFIFIQIINLYKKYGKKNR